MYTKQEAVLKLFGTGQITIPKEWRDFFGTKTLKAIFDRENRKINICPIRMVELEDTKKILSGQLKKDLDETNFGKKFKQELLAGYKKSDFYSNK